MHLKLIKLLTVLSLVFLIACKKTTSDPFYPTNPAFAAVDEVLNDSVPVRFGGNCYVVIHKDGEVVYEKAMGNLNADTRTFIASCSKWLSAAVLMSLVDEGKLALNDTLGKYMPIFTTYGKGGITLAQLFSHTSGLLGDSEQGFEYDNTITLQEAVDRIAQYVPLISLPGSRFYYGSVSMHIAGRVCEIVSGKNWETLAKEKIFDPCGMVNTDYGLTPNPIIAGGARSTAADYMRFLDMLAQKGVATNGTRVLSEAAVAAMQQDYVGNAGIVYTPAPPYLSLTNFYGIGNWRDYLSATGVLIENSSPGAFGTHPWINHEKGYTGIVFTFIPVNGYLSTLPTCITIRELVRGIIQ